jgi:hypothetical protein
LHLLRGGGGGSFTAVVTALREEERGEIKDIEIIELSSLWNLWGVQWFVTHASEDPKLRANLSHGVTMTSRGDANGSIDIWRHLSPAIDIENSRSRRRRRVCNRNWDKILRLSLFWNQRREKERKRRRGSEGKGGMRDNGAMEWRDLR